MKQLLLACALVIAAAQGGAAQGAGDIRAVISAQLDAFRAGDFAGAFGFASEGIRRIFGTSETFGAMVENGYAMVIAPAEVRFGEVREDGGGLTQRVLLRDGAGVWHTLDYLMVDEGGVWRIGGVEILGPPELGA